MTKQNTHNSENRYRAQEEFRQVVDKVVNTLVVLMMIVIAALAISLLTNTPIANGDDCPNGVCPKRYAPSNTVVPSRAKAPEPFYSNYPRFRYWSNPYIKVQPQKKPQKNKSDGRYRKVSETKCEHGAEPAVESIAVRRVDFISTNTVNIVKPNEQGNMVLVDTVTVHVTQRLVGGELEVVDTHDGKLEVVFRGKEWWLLGNGVIIVSPGRTITETTTIRQTETKIKNRDA